MNSKRAFRFKSCRRTVVSLALLVATIAGSCAVAAVPLEALSSGWTVIPGEVKSSVEPEVILIPSEENSGSTHLGALNISARVFEDRALQERTDGIVIQGGVAIVNHPVDCSVDPEGMADLTGYSGVETYNAYVARVLGLKGDMTDLWDTINTLRLERGMDLIWGFAADDAHRAEDFGYAYVAVSVARSDVDGVVASIKAGNFYASTGAAVKDVRVVAQREIVVTLLEESTIVFIAKGGVVVQTTESPSSSASYHVRGDEGYVRVEVNSPSGRAWTQPMRVSDSGVVGNPYRTKGRWVKGSIHCHSTESDGDWTPSQIIDWCASNGYGFVAITDHNRITAAESSR